MIYIHLALIFSQHLKPEVKVEMSDIIKFVKSFQIIMLKKLSTAADEEEIRKKQITELNEKVYKYLKMRLFYIYSFK